MGSSYLKAFLVQRQMNVGEVEEQGDSSLEIPPDTQHHKLKCLWTVLFH